MVDIEQIGHVYEGLLDHTAVRATEPVLGLTGTRDNEPEVPLSKLEELVEKGGNALEDFLKKETGRSSVTTINKMLNAEVDDQTANRFRTACHGDESLWKRIEPFAGLVRSDTFGYPAVIVSGSVYVTAGTDRRSSGTHYTPKSLTEPIVQYTLEPLVYEGPAEGKPKTEWKLKTVFLKSRFQAIPAQSHLCLITHSLFHFRRVQGLIWTHRSPSFFRWMQRR